MDLIFSKEEPHRHETIEIRFHIALRGSKAVRNLIFGYIRVMLLLFLFKHSKPIGCLSDIYLSLLDRTECVAQNLQIFLKI